MRALLWYVVICLWPAGLFAQSSIELEQNLSAIGYDVGAVDGVIDQKTRRAVQMFQYHFGFPVSEQLTAGQAKFLRNSVSLSKVDAPFIVEEKREQTENPEMLFARGHGARPERSLYANGAHYLATRGHFQFNRANLEISTTFTTPAMQLSGSRRSQNLSRADRIASQANDSFSQAVITLERWSNGPSEFSETTDAFAIILKDAQSNPEEPAYVTAMSEMMYRRTDGFRICHDAPEASVLSRLLDEAIQLAIAADVNPVHWSGLTQAALACTPQGQRDRIFDLRARLAKSVSQEAEAYARILWARDAFEIGQTARAQEQYSLVISLGQNRQGKAFFEGEALLWDLITTQDISALHRLNMAAERDIAAKRLIEHFEATPDPGNEASRAAMSIFWGFQKETAALFLELGRFDYLARQGARIQANNWRPGGVTVGQTEQGNIWEAGIIGLRASAVVDRIRLGGDLLPHVLKTQDWDIATEISLIRAEAAVEVADFDAAEAALLNVVEYAATSGTTAKFQPRIAAIREALAIFELRDLSPTERAVEQMRSFYGDNCDRRIPEFSDNGLGFPTIDLVAVSRDPRAAETLLRLNAIDIMLACLFDLKDIFAQEIQVLCTVAGFVGRKDVSDYIFDPSVAKNPYDYGPGSQRACIEGLALASQHAWANAHVPADKNNFAANNLRFLSAQPTERQTALGRINPAVIDTLDIWNVDVKELVVDRSPDMRVELMEAVRNAFMGGHGSMGPQDADFARAYIEAVAYQNMGLFNAAEATFYISQVVDPLSFGQETQAQLTADILNRPAVLKRLDYAYLYRDQGRYDEAYAAIGPLVELAVEQLSSSETALPGTVEQWSSRLKPAFDFYLALQFDPLSQGPNYPALFLVQQYLQLASSTASLSVLEQRLGSASPAVAREIQDIQRQIRAELQKGQADLTQLQLLNTRMSAAQAKLPQDDEAFAAHQIGVIQSLGNTATALQDSGAQLLFITQLPEDLIVTKVDGNSAVARRLDRTAVASRNEVARFRDGILNSNEATDTFDYALASKIYEELIGWSFEAEPASDLRLVIDGPQVTLPLGALRMGNDWLALKSSLRISPSVARASENMVRENNTNGFIGVGDPDLKTGDVERRSTLLGSEAVLPELPETARELAFMALAFGGNPTEDVFVRERANEATFAELNATEKLSNTRILAIATHGLLSTQAGQLNDAALVLSVPDDLSEDGLLTATEIYKLRISADLVILSACNTGTPDAAVGLSALSSAFFYSGTKGLLLTHWEIDSGAGVEIMKHFATQFRSSGDLPAPLLLQKAVAQILRDETRGRFHHPRFWASHFVIG